jgi:DNA gyrase inhibitor GyrI
MKFGMWTVGVTKDNRVFLETDDFTYDTRLYVNGDFADKDQEIQYASALARRLNGTDTA